MDAARAQVSIYEAKDKINADIANAPATIVPNMRGSTIPPPPPPPRITNEWEQNNPARRPIIGPLLVGVTPLGNNRNISAPPPPVTAVSKPDWSEREHLHNLVNTLTIENVDLKSQRLVKDKLMDGLERQLKALETQNGRLKQQMTPTPTTASSDQSIKEVTSLTSTLSIKPVALEWPSTELFQGISSTSDTKRGATSKNAQLLSGPGIFLQLTGNPWRKIHESQALDDMVTAIIHALTVKQPSKTSLDEDEDSGSRKRKATNAFAFFEDHTYLTGNSSFYATDTPDQYRLPIRQIEFEKITGVLRATTKTSKHRRGNDVATQVSEEECATKPPDKVKIENKTSSTIQLNKINRLTTIDKTIIDPSIHVVTSTTAETTADFVSNGRTTVLQDWNTWVQISIGIIVHMFFVRLMELL